MGIYFEITILNTKTKKELLFEAFSLGEYEVAWEQAVQTAMEKFKKLWSFDGDNRYWVIKSIEDITRR